MDETRNFFIEEINQNQLKSEKYKKVCTTLIDIAFLLILFSVVAGMCFHSPFLVGTPISIGSFAVGLNKIEVSISRALTDSYFRHDKFLLKMC